MAKKPKRPRDPMQLAKLIGEIAVGEVPNDSPGSEARELTAKARAGRLGGLRGGKARAGKLSRRKRQEIAKKAAAARWKRST